MKHFKFSEQVYLAGGELARPFQMPNHEPKGLYRGYLDARSEASTQPSTNNNKTRN